MMKWHDHRTFDVLFNLQRLWPHLQHVVLRRRRLHLQRCFLCLCTFRPLTSSSPSSSPPLLHRLTSLAAYSRRKLEGYFGSLDGMRIVWIVLSRAEF